MVLPDEILKKLNLEPFEIPFPGILHRLNM